MTMKKIAATVFLLAFASQAFAQSATSDANATAEGTQAQAGFNSSSGRHNVGQVQINGRSYNADDIIPSGNNAAYVDRLKQIDGEGDMGKMKAAYDELKPQIDKDPSSWAEGARQSTAKPKELPRIEQDVNRDADFWRNQLDSLQKPQEVAGDMLAECNTKTVVTPGSKTHTYTEEKYCDIVNLSEEQQAESGAICQRQAEYTEEPTRERQEKVSQLFVTEEGNGTICKRETRAENYRDSMAGTITSTIDLTEEQGGLVCRRDIFAERVTKEVSGEKTATIPVDQQLPTSQVCDRSAWPGNATRPQSGGMNTTLNINNESGGLSCTRYRTAQQGVGQARVSGASGPAYGDGWFLGLVAAESQPATAIISGAVFVKDSGSCGAATLPSAAPFYFDAGNGYGTWTFTAQYNIADYKNCNAYYHVEYNIQAPTVTFSTAESGNCGDPGTASCPTAWQCTGYAPTTLNGINVTAAQVQGLPALFPGAPSTCTNSSLQRTCSGNTNTDNTVSIAWNLPEGTTSISNFGVSIANMQNGVSVSVVQVPSLANNWIAILRVNRSDMSYTPNPPNVYLSWIANVQVVNVGTVDNGNCNASGSTNCPTKWQCDVNAPTTINGITVTPEHAASIAPLFPGANSSCAKASLHRVCAGNASMSSVVSIADKLPEGTVAISNFRITVQNPQSGVTVQVTQAPTRDNGWNAYFNVVRTNFTYQPANPQVLMQWGATVVVDQTSVTDVGNCNDKGSAACPTRWSCTSSAPTTINGIAVSTQMAANHAPLFPGAGSTCVSGNLNRVCDGTSSQVSSIHIGHLLSRDSTSISDFAWKVNNPQAGVSITLVEAPTLANGWVARFSSSRNYAVATNPAKPSLTLNWNYLSELKVRTSVITTGDCGDIYAGIAAADTSTAVGLMGTMAAADAQELSPAPAVAARPMETSAFEKVAQAALDGVFPSAQASPMLMAFGALAPSTCPVAWVCTKTAPGYSNGIYVAQSDLLSRGELYPGENYTCLDAEYRRTCMGSGANRTVVSIADQVPVDAESIANFGWQVVNPGKGVAIALIQTPSKDNGWKAIFETTRTDWNIKPEQPTVRLAWDQKGIPEWDVNTVDQGDCAVAGDEFCQVKWVCLEEYPDDPAPVEEQFSSTFTFRAPDEMGASTNVNFSIAGTVRPGATAIHDFSISSLTGTADGAVVVVPSAANGWQGTLKVTTTGYEYEYQAGKPLSRYSQVKLSFRWKVGERPAVVDPPYKSQSPGPLFPGDDGSCKRAEKQYTCESIWEGEVCFTDDDGEEMCLEQPETDGPPNDCAELEADKSCTEVREQCSEGGMSSNGHCYVSTKVFECKVTVVGNDVNFNEETTCTGGGGTPCADGSCSQKENYSGSISGAAADAVTMQTMLIDHEKPDSGGGGGMAMRAEPSKADREGQGMLAAAFQVILDGVIPTASANDDPFGVPLPYPKPQPDPPGNPADALGPGVADDLMKQMKFFSGERESCKKMLGGLLDCCTKEPPDQQKQWWDRYRNFTRENGMAELAAIPDEWNNGGTGMWDNFDSTAGAQTLSQPFTSIAENISGGGSSGSGSVDATLADFSKQFTQYSDTAVKPKLGWYCKDHEKDLAIKKNLGQCTYVGSYCQTKGLLGECIVKMHVSCCFNSPVTKLIRDHMSKGGRFGLGSAKHPKCGGIPLSDLMSMSMEGFDSDEVEARMAAGGFTPDIADYAGLAGEEFDVAMFGSGNSLNDPSRKSLTERTGDRMEGLDENLGDGYDAISKDINKRSDTTNTDVAEPESPGAITFNPGLYFAEPGKLINIKVTRNGGKGTVSVTLRTVGGTASSGFDYMPINTTLTWGPNEIGTQSVGLQTLDLSGGGSTMKTVTLQITNATGGAIINPLSEATVEIQQQSN